MVKSDEPVAGAMQRPADEPIPMPCPACGSMPNDIYRSINDFERGRQQGMKQERALWELAESSREIGDVELPAGRSR